MARDANRQSAFTYEQFREQYEATRSGSRGSYEYLHAERETLEKKYPKFTSKYRLLDEPGSLHEGSTVFVIIRKHSRTGYSKAMSFYTFAVRTDAGYHASPEQPQLQPLTLTYHIAKLMGYTVHNSDGRDVLHTVIYAQEFIAHLSQALFGVDKANALRCEVL